MTRSAEVTVRPATLADIRAVAEFQTDTWNENYATMVPAEYLAKMTVETREVRWGARIRAGERRMLLALRGGRIIGAVSFGEREDERPGPRLELMSLYISATERSSGLGARLLELALDGRGSVLWVFEANERAIAFYRRHGFLPDGERTIDADTGLPEVRLSR
jgi:ribosomal protein S18 acetylase RimI-like enzyme